MTHNQLIEHVLAILDDPAGDRWSTAEITAYLNEAQREFGSRTGLLRRVETLQADATATPATAFYILPASTLSLERVEYAGRSLRLLDLSAFNGYDWTTQAGEPEGYILGPWGPALLRLYPYPAAALNNLVAYYAKNPADIAIAGEPEIPQAWHPALGYFAAARCYLRDLDYKDTVKGSTFQALYEAALQEALRHAPTSSPSVPFRYL